jgi:hypothetical protein
LLGHLSLFLRIPAFIVLTFRLNFLFASDLFLNIFEPLVIFFLDKQRVHSGHLSLLLSDLTLFGDDRGSLSRRKLTELAHLVHLIVRLEKLAVELIAEVHRLSLRSKTLLIKGQLKIV